jgi:hypothetical protein
MEVTLSRRKFSQYLGLAVIGSGALSVQGLLSPPALAQSAASFSLTPPETQALVIYAHLLLPILPPDDSAYQQSAAALVERARLNSQVAMLLRSNIDELVGEQSGSWLTMSAQERAALVAQQAGTPFYSLARWATTETVMRDFRVWEMVGYQGSAIDKGGYLHRGFDDIDWLPPVTSKN